MPFQRSQIHNSNPLYELSILNLIIHRSSLLQSVDGSHIPLSVHHIEGVKVKCRLVLPVGFVFAVAVARPREVDADIVVVGGRYFSYLKI